MMRGICIQCDVSGPLSRCVRMMWLPAGYPRRSNTMPPAAEWGDHGLPLVPFHADREEPVGRIPWVIHAPVPILQSRHEPVQRVKQGGSVACRPHAGEPGIELRLPINLDHVEIGIKVLEHVPGD